MKTLIFSDLDGTLLDHFTYQATAALPTLQQLQAANIPVILNTSKTLAEIELIQQTLGLTTPVIIENGAAIYIPIGTFDSQPKGTSIKGNYWVKTFCSPREYWLDFLSKHAKEYAMHFQGFSTISSSSLSKLTGLTQQEAVRAKQREYGEPINWLGDEALKKDFINDLTALGAYIVQGGRFLHIGGNCDKGQAMMWLVDQYQKNFNEQSILTIALGDGENDSSMLEVANIAVQIHSPIHKYPKLHRQEKTIQTKLFGPEGWAEAIQHLLCEQLSSSPTHSEKNYG